MTMTGMEHAPFVRNAGKSGQLWDVWQSPESVSALDGWIGLVQYAADGYRSQDAERHQYGPFATQQEAIEALRARNNSQH